MAVNHEFLAGKCFADQKSWKTQSTIEIICIQNPHKQKKTMSGPHVNFLFLPEFTFYGSHVKMTIKFSPIILFLLFENCLCDSNQATLCTTNYPDVLYPVAVTEEMLYATTRLSFEKGQCTGFFFDLTSDSTTLVTNKHCCSPEEKGVEFYLSRVENGCPTNVRQKLYIPRKFFLEHHDVDLCIILIPPTKMTNIFFKSIPKKWIWEESRMMKELQVVEDVFMFGYPGLNPSPYSDSLFPVIRSGITAVHPGLVNDYGLVDMPSLGGSSGSPVLILNEHTCITKHGNVILTNCKRYILLGVNCRFLWGDSRLLIQEEQFNAQGNSNFGEYVPARKLLEMTNMIANFNQVKVRNLWIFLYFLLYIQI
tara:strand:- start:10652 stop:11749 length:1098 start_codon:yes stop_codon:yes gene_type:complete